MWKHGPGSLIAATGLQELAPSQRGGWLAEEDEERIAEAAAVANRRCRERSELEGVIPGTRVGSSCDRLSRRNCRETESFQNVLHLV